VPCDLAPLQQRDPSKCAAQLESVDQNEDEHRRRKEHRGLHDPQHDRRDRHQEHREHVPPSKGQSFGEKEPERNSAGGGGECRLIWRRRRIRLLRTIAQEWKLKAATGLAAPGSGSRLRELTLQLRDEFLGVLGRHGQMVPRPLACVLSSTLERRDLDGAPPSRTA
jgi:hypothetical protein